MVSIVNPNYSVASGGTIRGGTGTPVLAIVAAGLSAGQAVEIDVTDIGINVTDGLSPLEGAGNDTWIDWHVNGAYDPRTQRAVSSGAPAGSLSNPERNRVGEYDFNTNRYTAYVQPWNLASGIGHNYSSFDINGRSELWKMVFGSTGTIQRWDVANQTTLSPVSGPPTSLGSGGSYNSVHALAYHPNRGAGGSWIQGNSNGGRVNQLDQAIYDSNPSAPVGDYWSNITSGLTIAANSGCAHYNPTSDRVVVSGGGLSDSVILVPASGNHIVAGNMPAAVFLANGTANFIPDPSSATSLIIEVDGTVHPLDTTNGTWGSTTSVPSPLSQVNGLADTQYIPISDLGVILIVVYAGSNSSRMFMWRYS